MFHAVRFTDGRYYLIKRDEKGEIILERCYPTRWQLFQNWVYHIGRRIYHRVTKGRPWSV